MSNSGFPSISTNIVAFTTGSFKTGEKFIIISLGPESLGFLTSISVGKNITKRRIGAPNIRISIEDNSVIIKISPS